MGQNSPRRQHYVPRFYLEYFARQKDENQPGFWIYDKSGSPPKTLTPLNTAVKRDIYTLITPDGTKDTVLERELFARVDGEGKQVLDRWIARGAAPLVKPEVDMVTLYVALQYLRTPQAIRAFNAMEEVFAETWWKQMAEQPKEIERMWREAVDESGKHLWESPAALADQLKNFKDHYKIVGDPKRALLHSIMQLESIHKRLQALVPKILLAPKGNFFITSDSPVNVLVPSDDGKALFGAGFGLPRVEVVFPINPEIALILSHAAKPAWYHATGKEVIEYNRRCVRAAEKMVISPFESRRVVRHIKEFEGHSPILQIDSKAVEAQVAETW